MIRKIPIDPKSGLGEIKESTALLTFLKQNLDQGGTI
jgi:hypothetical protein